MRRILYIAFLLSGIFAAAQAPSKWYKKFGGAGIDIGYGVKETFNRQYIVVGSSNGFGSGSVDAYVALIDSMGQMLWQKNFGGALTDVAKSVVVNPVDSGFIFTGYTNSFGNGGYDLYVVRTDKNGVQIWQKSFGGIDWDFGDDIVLAPDGNIIICGNTYNGRYGKKDAWILKLNAVNGNLQWEKYYGGAEDDEFRAIHVASPTTTNLIFVGETKSYDDAIGDIYFLKTDLNGDSIVYRSHGLPGKEDFANSITNDANLIGYVLAGGTESYSSFGKDAFIFGTNLNGDSTWLQHYGNANYDQEAIKVLPDASVTGTYVLSYSDNEGFFKRNPKNLILNYLGLYYSGHDFGDTEDEELYDISNASDKGFIGVGYTKSWASVNQDIFIVKYDSTVSNGGSLIGLNEQKMLISHKTFVYPSIISNEYSTVIIECKGKFTFSVFDVLSNEVLSTGAVHEKTALLDLTTFPPGMFFVRVTQDSKTETYKVIKQN